MKSSSLFTLALLPFPLSLAWADVPKTDGVRTEIRSQLKWAEPEKPVPKLPTFAKNPPKQTAYTEAELRANPALTQQLLAQAIYARQAEAIEALLAIYQTFPQQDGTLVQFAHAKIAMLREDYTEAIHQYRQMLADKPDLNAVRIELAIALFQQKQDNAAKAQFQQAKTAENLPAEVGSLIDAYLTALAERDGWNVDFSAHYLRESNVNNVANSREIEQTGFVKGAQMLPQKAHGLAYNFGLSRDFNLHNSHYLAFENDFDGKSYWDNHDYDDLSNRTALGYRWKTARQTLSVLPFYEKRWYGGEKYRWSNGVRLEFAHWFNPNWQLSTAVEGSKARYFDSTAQNGNNKLLSATLLWLRNPKQFFYVGADFNAERTQVRQYSSDSKSLRLGWGQEWGAGISSRVSVSFTQRHYKDLASLGGILPLGKVRQDKVYGVNLQLWKRDWHVFGITPKLVYSWRKQASNIPTMYAYTEKNVNVVFEKRF